MPAGFPHSRQRERQPGMSTNSTTATTEEACGLEPITRARAPRPTKPAEGQGGGQQTNNKVAASDPEPSS
jgi:hypothetical protein